MIVCAETAHLIDTVKETIEKHQTKLKSNFYCHDILSEEGVIITSNWSDSTFEFGYQKYMISIPLSIFNNKMSSEEIIDIYNLYAS